MDKLEMVRLALVELGDVPGQELADHIERLHGVRIDPKFLPVFKASLRNKQQLAAAREAARAVIAAAPAEAADT